MKIDINCDMGEIPEAVIDGSQEALMPYLTSANIACGAHAGNEAMMSATIQQAMRANIHIGAHPGYPDRANFGRLPLAMPYEQVADFVHAQVLALATIALRHGATIHHVKPHGALYNSAVAQPALSQAIAEGVSRWSQNVILVGLAGSTMLNVFRAAGFTVAAEAFADRRYEADGSLRSRKHADSLITDPTLAAQQALDIVKHGYVTAVDGTRVGLSAQTLCIHGDTPGALEIVKEVWRQLQ
jgi:UPF0271 protein